MVNNISVTHRQVIPFTQEKLQTFNPVLISNKLVEYYIMKGGDKTTANLIKVITDYSKSTQEDIQKLIGTSTAEITKKRVEEAISKIIAFEEKIVQSVLEAFDDESKYKKYFDTMIIQKGFQSQLNTVLSDDNLNIVVMDGVTKILTLTVDKNVTTTFEVENPLYLKDATAIETPTIIQLADFITNTLAFSPEGNKRADLPTHFLDLTQKIRAATTSNNANF